MPPEQTDMTDGTPPRPLYCFNGGFFTQSQVRRILSLSGFEVSFGKPGPQDLIGVWGKAATSARGETIAEQTGAQIVHIEDALLRSVLPGRSGAAPIGLTIDHKRPYFDSSRPSDLEELLANDLLDDAAELTRARQAISQLQAENISKYNDFDLDAEVPEPGYVLVIDQSREDASITYGSANVGTFREMLVFAQEEHPETRIVVKTHPDTMQGYRNGHFDASHMGPNMTLFDTPCSPYALLEGAIAVYTVSSGMGFEAILAGHKPVVFGQPFYAGWGLTDDRQPIDRRQRKLTRAQLFLGAMIKYPRWYDPYRDRLCEIEDVINTLSAQSRAHREDKAGYCAAGLSRWKHRHVNAFYSGKMAFSETPSRDTKNVIWGAKYPERKDVARMEDGFLRSNGLGADLIPPLSLVLDQSGIYFDATRPSDLENWIRFRTSLSPYAQRRAEKLRQNLTRHHVSKYNLSHDMPEIDTDGRTVVLVPGQVEDDASILLGCTNINTNRDLLAEARRAFPDDFIIFKPHPDVEAGLRPGGEIDPNDADFIAQMAPADGLLQISDRVVTMTSLMGFEALLRGKEVTCYGTPFYAGCGLTDDRGEVPARRTGTVELDGLVHAVLIDYPRYFDPITQSPCPVEVVVDRLISGQTAPLSRSNRLTSRLQRMFARFAPLWR